SKYLGLDKNVIKLLSNKNFHFCTKYHNRSYCIFIDCYGDKIEDYTNNSSFVRKALKQSIVNKNIVLLEQYIYMAPMKLIQPLRVNDK
ncbi:hypothetical protein, partial [Veillonella ratti]|uniref:hypothetical protein n=1 Tax=Veillonella ratti TaxID=103892 RepID=UPI0019D1A5FD